jgi:hypothetical protein
MPEGDWEGWRPPIRESVLEGMEQEEATLRARVEAEFRQEHLRTQLTGLELGSHLDRIRWALVPDDDDRRRQDDDAEVQQKVEAQLGRELSPAERVLVRHLRGQGKPAPAIAAALR